MKKLLFTLAFIFVSSLVMGQTQTENYIHTTTYQTETKTGSVADDKKIENITYFDGLGRPMQSIAKQAGGQKQDIITPIVYDNFGRQVKDYLPYARSSTSLNYMSNLVPDSNEDILLINSQYLAKYPVGLNTVSPNPFSEKNLEASPLSRVLEQAAPGADWVLDKNADTDHTIKFEYATNGSNEVKLYNVSLNFANNTYTPTLIAGSSYYEANELYKTVTKDENWSSGTNHTTEEFKDKQGQVVLKRTYADLDLNNDGDTNDAGESEVSHDTYYVYDDFGNLTYILPPKVDTTDGVSATELSELCYQYKYDDRNRLVEKKIPGKGLEYIVYNNLDQPILTQDDIQKTNGEWLFTKYDAFGRIAYTGKSTSANTTTRETIQTEVNASIGNLWVTQSGTSSNYGGVSIFYNNGGYPNNSGSLVTLSEILTINYYDTYVDRPTGAPSSVILMESSPSKTNATNVKGLTTVNKVKVLDATGTNVWINTLTYYDSKSRPIYAYSDNTYLGTVDIIETKLDFTGKLLKSKTTHTRNGITIATIENYTYDHTGRLLTQTQCIGDQTMGYTCTGSSATVADLSLTGDITTDQVASKSIIITNGTILPNTRLWISPEEQEVIVNNTYDELGQLESKGVGGKIINANRLQTVDYTYNIRGWLKQINDPTTSTTLSGNDDLFGFKINYNTTEATSATPLYNGNISEIIWRTASEDYDIVESYVKNSYVYNYDALNRIKRANMISDASDWNNKYNLKLVEYDKNGNITKLKRNGFNVETSKIFVEDLDDLTYTYDSGNKLTDILEDGDHYEGFIDKTNTQTGDYTYDANGNMTQDLNKGITGITYNHLNLPTLVNINDGVNDGFITYIYDATGVKLKKVVDYNISMETGITTYAGNYVYESPVGSPESLKFFNHPEGYVEPKNPSDLSQGFNYIYQYKDHLGNVRLSYMDVDGSGSITASTEILEENNYYPFGLKHKGYNNVVNGTDHPYGYNGKEEQNELNFNTLDFGARFYDPATARWFTIDALAEQYYNQSTFAYGVNNPIIFIDPDGNQVEMCCQGLKDFVSSGWSSYKTTLSNTYKSAKQLATSPVQTVKTAASNHFGQLKSPQGVLNLTNQALDQIVPVNKEIRMLVESSLSDNFAKTYGEKKGEQAADLTIEGVGLLAGEVLGKGATLLKGLSKVDDAIVVVGQGMDRVKGAANALLENGSKSVEVFSPSKGALKEWNKLISGGEHLSDDVVKGTKLYGENQAWIQKAKESGKTILDIGENGSGKSSTFYEMEKQVIYGNQ